MRLQLALNVHNLEESVNFYTKMFNTPPHKVKNGYANFAISAPPLKLVLFEKPNTTEKLNHLGVEVFDQASLEQSSMRFKSENLQESNLEATECCYAAQNKTWVTGPDGLSWEWYQIIDDNSDAKNDKHTSCCA